MTIKHLQEEILRRLNGKIPHLSEELHFYSAAGGSINETYRLVSGKHQFFCKINSADSFPGLFREEKKGLELINGQGNIRTPVIIDEFVTGNYQVLLMEWIDNTDPTDRFWKKFGEQLAKLHSSHSEFFGLDEDNYMGSVPQANREQKDWPGFFREQRLQPLIDRCHSKNLLLPDHLSKFDQLYSRLPEIFDSGQKPALVHGDLWNGNYLCDNNSEPVLIDPAVYYGHPSVDLGMTTLFGGFSPLFYEAYHYHSPFPDNYKQQWQVCNIYPLLIHLLLFGKSYLSQIEFTLKTIS